MRKYLESIRMLKLSALILPALFILLAAPVLPAQAQRAMTAADILRVASVSDAQISPDGEWVVYTVSTTEASETRNTLWLVRARRNTAITRPDEDDAPFERAAPVQLLAPGWSASNPRWSPDSKRIAFRATQQERSGIWIISLGDRQPRLVAPIRETNFFITYAGESFAWSPDSRRIAFISATEETRVGERPEVARTPSRAVAADDPRVVDRIQYKSRTSFSDRARTHVWVVEVDSSLAGDERATRQLTAGAFYDHALTWSPRSDEVAFLSNHEPDPDANNNSDIFAVDMSGRVRQITDTAGCEYEPTWSPDGKLIAYTATKRDVTTIDSVAEDTHVWVIDAGGGAGRELTAAQDRRARSPRWSPASNGIYFLAGDRGQNNIYFTRLSNGPAWKVISSSTTGFRDLPPTQPRPAQVSSFSLNARYVTVEKGLDYTYSAVTLAFTLSDAVHPAEVWTAQSLDSLNATGRRMHRLTAHNDSFMRTLTLSDPEPIKFTSFDGTPVEGWLMKPVGWREDRRYPLILSVHGGPHGMSGYSFNPTFQVYAARGYGVLYLNPRGSSGYGQKFSDGTLREWGGGDYRDLMMGVDEALRTRSWIDPDRLGVTGGSYGGFMTNWIITQTTRFKAAVSQASVSNLISFYATSLYQDLIQAEFGGFPWDDYDLLWRWSPLRYVKQAQTPTLLIHGEADNDVHITQAEEMYTALKRRGIETVLIRYPREGHGLREPLHRVDALERTLAWFDKFLK
ncbi:MAG TPA: S9 family peptidase [Pyrinomonadaceae bacterium]|nr:S9 family peptidase [Pyrinomonadaceae bacterium]